SRRRRGRRSCSASRTWGQSPPARPPTSSSSTQTRWRTSGTRGRSRACTWMVACWIAPHCWPNGNGEVQRRSDRSVANQSQHVAASLDTRPPEGVVPGGVVLQAKLRVVREEGSHRLHPTAAKHRTVG